MPDTLTAAILRTWSRQRDYAVRLVADLSDADMVSQPVPGVTMNHAAWVFCHIGIYPPVLAAILQGRPFVDPINDKYGRDSRPLSDPAAYPRKSDLMRTYLAGHDELARVLEHTDPAILTRPIPLDRWKERFPFIADAIVHLMIDHESAHLGQISAWRRAGRKPAV